jgi:hypothetical protein
MTAATGTTKRTRLLPSWVLKLIGFGSLATAVISFAIYWFKKYPPRRRIDRTDNDSSNAEVVVHILF